MAADSPSTSSALETSEPDLTDGRQSERALAIRRGTARMLAHEGAACLFEATLANGRRADIVALMPDGTITIIEVKSSLADLRADMKWPDYIDFCDRFTFATGPDVPADAFPQTEGLIIADGYGAHTLRAPRLIKLHASRRKALMLRLARHAMGRLHRLDDPASGAPDV
ncbi:MAG: MmcB family DNA repair protein [Devosiaceae bacterium]|nr:MmcB family DNA repair protein [Devosiaceae bacterium MH13]